MASNIPIVQPEPAPATKAPSLPVVGNDLQNEKAWSEALGICKKNSRKSSAAIVFQSTGPKDIRKYLEDVQQQQKKNKLAKTMRGLGTCIDALVRHEKAMDMFAQAGGMPGCVAWGSIRLVLGLAEGCIKDYERLLKTLADISAWLEAISVEATAFSDSPMVTKSLVALYVHIIGFWMKAYNVFSSSKSRKLFGAFKAIWTDYDDEFKTLKQSMDKDFKRFLVSANAEHHRQFSQFNQSALENRRAIEHRDAVRWLAPGEDVTLGIDFYQTELTNAYSSRQAGTCEWILLQEKYLNWSAASSHDPESFLWITAIPGAGKTVLAAFVAVYNLAIGHKNTFYFFFSSADGYMTTVLSAGKCLLYQLYMYAREAGEVSHSDLHTAAESSGGSKAKSFEAVWNIVLKYASRLTRPIFIIDALDEVAEPDLFLTALLELVQKTSALVLLTSRPSAAPPDANSKFTFMEFGLEHRHDIETYIESRTAHGLTSLPQIRSTIVKALVTKNDGMFLWVRLILEELECRYSIEEMELVLKSLPTDLDGVYAKILRNLKKALKQSQKEFCHKILTWLFCARRPLSTKELYAAMKSEYAEEGFLYTAETIPGAIRAVCGPLVVFRMDSVHLVHFSLKEFLTKSPAQWTASQQELQDFHIDARMGNLHIMKVCLADFEAMASVEKLFPTEDGSSNIDFGSLLVTDRWPLVEYSSFNWMNHAWQSGLAELATLQALATFVQSKASIIWIYISMVIDVAYIELLRWDVRSMLILLEPQLLEDSPLSPQLDEIRRCSSWCNFVTKLISDYGNTLEENPAVLFDLDLQALAQETKFQPPWILEISQTICQRFALEPHFTLKPTRDIPANRQLHTNVSETRGYGYFGKHDPAALGLFHVIKRFGAFIYASYHLSGKPQLLIQECLTGKRLAPVACDIEFKIAKIDRGDRELVLLDSAVSEDETKLAAVYGAIGNYWYFTCVWQLIDEISFNSDPFEAHWAEVTFHTTTFQPIFDGSAKLLLFASNHLLWCPAGLVDTTTGSVTPYAIKMPDVPSREDEAHPESGGSRNTHSLTLYGNGDAFMFNREWEDGEFLFNALRLSSAGAKLGDITPPENYMDDWLIQVGGVFDRYLHSTEHCNLIRTDETGRLIVWTNINHSGKRKWIVLHDTRNGKHATLQPMGWSFAIENILFVDHSKLVVFATYNTDLLDLQISTWDTSSNDSGPSKIASRKYRDNLCGMCVSADRETLYLVTTNRIITPLALPNLEEREDYLGFHGQHREVIRTFPAVDGTHIASTRSDQTRVDVKIWDVQQPSGCQKFIYQPTHIIPESSEITLSPNFEWIFFGDNGYEVYAVSKDGLPGISTPPRLVEYQESQKRELDSVALKGVDLKCDRSTRIYDKLYVANRRKYEDGHSHVHFSACGRYAVMAMDSYGGDLHASLILWSIDTKPWSQTNWNCVPIVHAKKFAFPAAKISVNFDALNPVCVLTFWVQPNSSMDRALCSIHCFVLDLKQAAITHCLYPITLYLEDDSIPSIETLDHNFSGNTSQAWVVQMDMIERSAVLSRCGEHLVLSACIGGRRHQMIIEIPNITSFTFKKIRTKSIERANPRVIEPAMTYWHQHRYWMSVYHQRILLHRSARSVINRNIFSSLSCHVQLSVLPAYLADAKTWLLIPESNISPMTILVTTKDHPLELWKLQVSWDTVIGKLEDHEAEHGDAIVALD